MLRYRLLSLLLVACPISGWADDSLARFFPQTTAVYAQCREPASLVATIFDHPLREKIESLPPYQTALETPAYRRFQLGRVFVEGHFGMPWRQAIETYAAGGISFAVDRESEGVAVLVEGKDSETMQQFRDKLIELAKLGENGDEIESGEYRGVTAYQVDKAKFAVYENRMLVTNQGDLGKAILDRLIDGDGPSLADNPRFQSASESADDAVTVWGFVDIKELREAGVAEPIYQDQIDNPVLELLLGGIQSNLQHTGYATAAITAKSEGLIGALSMPHQAAWIPETREYYFGPDGNGRAPQLPQVDDTLLTLSTYRDISLMWLRAGDLFGQQVNDGFAQADANLTTLFAGRDFGEDILGSIEPEVGLIATRNDLSDTVPRPTIKVPAFAVVTELREPETMSRELRRIFFNLIGFLNVVGAMNGQNQLELESEKLEGGGELVSSHFIPEADDRESTQAEIIFNFSPSIAFSGSRFVVSSTRDLARELILAEPAESSDGGDDNTRVRLAADVLRDILADNRGQLIAQNMLEDGNSPEEAEAVIDLLLEVVGYFNQASLTMAASDGELNIELAVEVKTESHE